MMQTRRRFSAKPPGAMLRAALLFFVAVGAGAGSAVAGETVVGKMVEFSAEMVQQIPNQRSIPGRLYVSKEKIRMETGAGQNRKITIVNFTDKKTLHLNPMRKEYMEVPWPPGTADPSRLNTRQPLPGDPHHRCANSAQLKCKMLGKNEKIGGRETEKWEIVQSSRTDGQAPQTGHPQTMRSVVWVDRKLGANVREERFIDGELQGASELRAIEKGPQPETLFQAPADYQRLEIPGGGGAR